MLQSHIRVLLVDCNQDFRTKLAERLEREPRIDVVGAVADGNEAIQKTAELSPDIVIIDIIEIVKLIIVILRKIIIAEPIIHVVHRVQIIQLVINIFH